MLGGTGGQRPGDSIQAAEHATRARATALEQPPPERPQVVSQKVPGFGLIGSRFQVLGGGSFEPLHDIQQGARRL